ncbi:hypothetical protein A2434_00280 [Candidatus Woesebacteria bacterium RIFOXYC1_FULL_41_14]|uniref:DUF4446 domain-containing protein n=2 Tax=Candidatus Woeseibacteriota TaxID=1752722 RepID=A0A1F8DJH9_9BACT|nr:MAG: hypothetical protein A2393_03260 [Candidatus Woesebacteria bacterium RIFOXYB1_FULL_41_13]OGM84845.1 MAG: hypothetical protein A2434_00280 [Candidatus Woesebacteria bacterium RIFOXYC1_FULL_41_14]OGM88767.1 MAG: hypothetical protein A2594_02920 [Candidatus Woesebacteria bacterium RIFOXYD1_FULL_41_28]
MENPSLYIFIFVGIWLTTLSVFLYRFFTIYKKLTEGVGVGDIKKILEKILSRGDENYKNISDILRRLDSIDENDRRHIQKVGLVRFNPFSELGGDHSFCLAILDDRDTGVVITGLHTRDRTRVYMKDIRVGKSNFELSAEEKKAILSAQKSK